MSGETSMPPALVIARVAGTIGAQDYRVDMKARHHALVADERKGMGGEDAGPAPYDYLLSGLGACTVITLRMYAQRKGWPVKQIKATVHLVKGPQQESGSQHTFVCELQLSGELDEDQRARMLEISKACPIQRLLAKPCEVLTTLAPEKG